MKDIGEYVKQLGDHALIIVSESGHDRVGEMVEKSLEEASVRYDVDFHEGEASRKEIERLCEKVKEKEANLIIALGGGKIIDTAKAVARYEDIPVAICPTSASTDAPTSALSVIYTDEGEFEDYLFHPKNPDIVLMDTDVIAQAPARLIVAGMGDAIATWFEARMAAAADAENMVGGKPTRAGLKMAELCYSIIQEEGVKAKLAVEAKALTESVERVVEANTLLSGLGFESAGLSAAHAIHNAMSVLEKTKDCMHGEKVSFGVMVQLVLENVAEKELEEVLELLLALGLPVCLEDLGVTEPDEERLRKMAEGAADPDETAQNMPFHVDAEKIYHAILAADAIGRHAKGLQS